MPVINTDVKAGNNLVTVTVPTPNPVERKPKPKDPTPVNPNVYLPKISAPNEKGAEQYSVMIPHSGAGIVKQDNVPRQMSRNRYSRIPDIAPRNTDRNYVPPMEEKLDTVRSSKPIDDLENNNTTYYDQFEDGPKNLVSVQHSDPSHNKWGHLVHIVTDGTHHGVELIDCKNRLVGGVFGVSKEDSVKAFNKIVANLSNAPKKMSRKGRKVDHVIITKGKVKDKGIRYSLPKFDKYHNSPIDFFQPVRYARKPKISGEPTELHPNIQDIVKHHVMGIGGEGDIKPTLVNHNDWVNEVTSKPGALMASYVYSTKPKLRKTPIDGIPHPGDVTKVTRGKGILNFHYSGGVIRGLLANAGMLPRKLKKTLENGGTLEDVYRFMGKSPEEVQKHVWHIASMDPQGRHTPLAQHKTDEERKDYFRVGRHRSVVSHYFDANGNELDYDTQVAPYDANNREEREHESPLHELLSNIKKEINFVTIKPENVHAVRVGGKLLLKSDFLHGRRARKQKKSRNMKPIQYASHPNEFMERGAESWTAEKPAPTFTDEGVHPHLVGTRLSRHLQELKHDLPELSEHVDNALRGPDKNGAWHGPESPFKSIGRVLHGISSNLVGLGSSDPDEHNQIQQRKRDVRKWKNAYRWDQVDAGLHTDYVVHNALSDLLGGTQKLQAKRYLAQHVPGVTETRNGQGGKTFHIKKNFYEMMSDPQKRAWDQLRKNVLSSGLGKRGVNPSTVDEIIVRSLFRNAVKEHNLNRGKMPNYASTPQHDGDPRTRGTNIERFRRKPVASLWRGGIKKAGLKVKSLTKRPRANKSKFAAQLASDEAKTASMVDEPVQYATPKYSVDKYIDDEGSFADVLKDAALGRTNKPHTPPYTLPKKPEQPTAPIAPRSNLEHLRNRGPNFKTQVEQGVNRINKDFVPYVPGTLAKAPFTGTPKVESGANSLGKSVGAGLRSAFTPSKTPTPSRDVLGELSKLPQPLPTDVSGTAKADAMIKRAGDLAQGKTLPSITNNLSDKMKIAAQKQSPWYNSNPSPLDVDKRDGNQKLNDALAKAQSEGRAPLPKPNDQLVKGNAQQSLQDAMAKKKIENDQMSVGTGSNASAPSKGSNVASSIPSANNPTSPQRSKLTPPGYKPPQYVTPKASVLPPQPKPKSLPRPDAVAVKNSALQAGAKASDMAPLGTFAGNQKYEEGETPEQYAQRAPAGGIVVREGKKGKPGQFYHGGIFYRGGVVIPKLV